jgi:amidase
MRRRDLLARWGLGATLMPAATLARAASPGALPPDAPATALREALASGRLTSEALLAACRQRIDAIDRAGPRLRSVVELNPEAAREARRLDAERRAGRQRGPLHGLPVLLKDNIATGDRMATTAGSLALQGVRAAQDAPLVARLREAGALILGKTNLSEWANLRSTRSTSGWSSRGGLTRNPHATDRSASGSSSGSGVAVAAALAPLAVGTETDGSIISPASANGIVGLKPTVGRISRHGVIPISHTQDTAGPMTRTVADAALLLAAMAGPDPRDPVTAGAPPLPPVEDLLASLGRASLQGVRLGVARAYFTGHAQVDALIGRALDDLRAAGAELVDVDLPRPTYGGAELQVLLHEIKPGIAAWLRDFAPHAGVKDLADVIAFNEREAARVMPHFGQEFLLMAQATTGLDAPAYREALAACARGAREEGLGAVFAKHRVEALVAPSAGVASLIDFVNGDFHVGGGFSRPAAVAGWPHLTVPAGFVGGLPAGLSFVGPAWSEPRLLQLGHAYERLTRHRRLPALRRDSRAA